MEDLIFNTPAGQDIPRENLVAYLNTGESKESPVWSALGYGVDSSSAEYDWSRESNQDIYGRTKTTVKKPVITQPFDALPLEADDTAARKIWNLGIRQQNAQSLANQDMLIAHFYAGASGKNFAERYSACSVLPTNIGGDGGAHIVMDTEVTYSGERTIGTVSRDSSGIVTFTPEREG